MSEYEYIRDMPVGESGDGGLIRHEAGKLLDAYDAQAARFAELEAQVAKLQAVAVGLASGPSSLDKLRAIDPAYGGMACIVLLRDIHALQAVADALRAWMATTDLSDVTDYGPEDSEWTTWWVLQYALAALEAK